jgi:predicted nucleic acid-binding Zn ribbon protein
MTPPRGIPPSRRRPTGDGSDTPHLIGGSVEAYLKSQGLSSTNTMARVLSAWSSVVGEEIAAHASPTAVNADELLVTVDHATWATELRLLSSRILTKLETQLGTPIAARMKVQVRA